MIFDKENTDIKDIEKHFSTKESCLSYLASKKWEKGFVCRKCGHTNSCKGDQPFSRRCTRCKHLESATAHTLFHACKIPLPEAFRLTFLVCNKPGISSYEVSRIMKIRQMTCWKFKKKITECVDSNGRIDLIQKNGD